MKGICLTEEDDLYMAKHSTHDESSAPKKSIEESQSPADKGVVCEWKGCESHYTGGMPPGWRSIAVYEDGPFDGEIDGELCPTHVKELGKYLKLGFRLELASMENRGENN
jgi:hypothetical protein